MLNCTIYNDGPLLYYNSGTPTFHSSFKNHTAADDTCRIMLSANVIFYYFVIIIIIIDYYAARNEYATYEDEDNDANDDDDDDGG